MTSKKNLTTIDLNPDSKHTPERTAQLARVLSESVRTLNYATLGPQAEGVGWPHNAQDLLYELAVAAERSVQLYGQIDAALRLRKAEGLMTALRSNDKSLDEALASVGAHLEQAAALSTSLGVELRAAFNDLSGTYPVNPNPEQDQDEEHR